MAVAKELFDIYEIARRQGWLARLWSLFATKHRVLILGSMGVGKRNSVMRLSWSRLAANSLGLSMSSVTGTMSMRKATLSPLRTNPSHHATWNSTDNRNCRIWILGYHGPGQEVG